MTHPTDPKGRECSEAASSNEAGKVEEIVQDLLLHAGEFPKRDLSAIGRYILSRESALRKRVESLERQVTYANRAYTDLTKEMRDLDDETYGKIGRLERQLGDSRKEIEKQKYWHERFSAEATVMGEEISRLKAEGERYRTVLENIKTVTSKANTDFTTLVRACEKTGDLDLIDHAKNGDAIASLVYHFAEKALAIEKENV